MLLEVMILNFFIKLYGFSLKNYKANCDHFSKYKRMKDLRLFFLTKLLLLSKYNLFSKLVQKSILKILYWTLIWI